TGREVDHRLGDDMDDDPLALQPAGAGDEAGAEDDAAEALEDGGPDDQGGDAQLVLDRHEDDAARRPRPLPDEDEPGDGDAAVDRQLEQVSGPHHPLA